MEVTGPQSKFTNNYSVNDQGICYFNGTLYLPRVGRVMKIDLNNGNQYSRFTGTLVPMDSPRKDGSKDVATFARTVNCITDKDGFVYVTDANTNNPHYVRKIDPLGNVVTFLNSTIPPYSLGIDRDSKLLVVDYWGNSLVRRIDGTSYSVIRSDLSYPMSVAADLLGNLFYVQNGNALYWISSSNIKRTLAGQQNIAGYAGGLGTSARFSGPVTIVFDSKGRLFLTDSKNNAIRMITWS